MRQPKPFIVEHKTRRTGGQRKSASSIWGNVDLDKALKDVESELDDHRTKTEQAFDAPRAGPGRDRD